MLNFYDLLKNYEGAGDPDTLFAHAQKTRSPFTGIKVSEMSLGQLEDFAAVDGSYGKWTKNKLSELGHEPRIATPMGIGQVVGTTLRKSAKELGLPDDTIFDEDTQRTIINHLARKRINLNDRDSTLKGLRKEWEGFKDVDDDVLWQAAHDVMGMEVDTFSLKRGKGADNFSTFQQDMRDGATAAKQAMVNLGKEGPVPELPNQVSPQIAQLMRERMPEQMKLTPPAARGPMGGSSHPYGNQRSGAGIPGGSSNPVAAAAQAAAAPQGVPPTTPSFSGAAGGGATAPSYPVGTPVDQEPTSAPAAAEAVKPEAETDQGEEGGNVRLFDRIASTLFPNADDPTDKFKTALGALSTGLGQMSHGQPVNLQPYFAGIAAQRQAAIDSAAEADQQAFDNRVKIGELAVKESNAVTAARRLEHDMRGTSGAMPFTPEQLAEFEADPDTRDFVSLLSSPDADARKAGLQGLRSALEGKAEKAVKENPQLGNLVRAISNGDVDKVAELVDTGIVSPNELSTMLNAASPEDRTSLYKNAEQLVADGQADTLSEGMMMISRAASGAPIVDELDRMNAKENFQLGVAEYNRYVEAADAATPLVAPLKTIRGITGELLMDNVDTGAFTSTLGYLNSVASSFSHLLPDGMVANNAKEFVTKGTGISAEQYESLNAAEKTIAFHATRQLLASQGTVTDSEREGAAQTVVNGNTDPATRMAALATMESANTTDFIMEQVMRDYRINDPTFQNIVPASGDMRTTARKLVGALSTAQQNRDGMRYGSEDQLNRPDLVQLGADIAAHRSAGTPVPEDMKKQFIMLTQPNLDTATGTMVAPYLRDFGYSHYYDTQKNEIVALP